METFSALLAICAGNSPVPGEFPAQRPVTRGFDVFVDLCPDKRLSKQWWGWWFETLSCPLRRHRNDMLWNEKRTPNRRNKKQFMYMIFYPQAVCDFAYFLYRSCGCNFHMYTSWYKCWIWFHHFIHYLTFKWYHVSSSGAFILTMWFQVNVN